MSAYTDTPELRLQRLAYEGDAAGAAALLAHDSEPARRPAQDPRAGPPLIAAAQARGGDPLAVTRLLLAHGADPNARDRQSTALIAAIEAGRRDVALALLAHGADPNAATARTSPLLAALQRGAGALVSDLLAAGADPNLTPGRLTPLELAVYLGRDSAIPALLEAGARVDRARGSNPSADTPRQESSTCPRP